MCLSIWLLQSMSSQTENSVYFIWYEDLLKLEVFQAFGQKEEKAQIKTI